VSQRALVRELHFELGLGLHFELGLALVLQHLYPRSTSYLI
jgi:hypothetical protein